MPWLSLNSSWKMFFVLSTLAGCWAIIYWTNSVNDSTPTHLAAQASAWWTLWAVLGAVGLPTAMSSLSDVVTAFRKP